MKPDLFLDFLTCTDITANDGTWTFLCGAWKSTEGQWAVFVNGQIADRRAIINDNQIKLRKSITKAYLCCC